MKKFSYIISLLLFLSVTTFAQQAPTGMKYQAVARNLKGEVLGDQAITLKVSLAANDNTSWHNYYSETHSVTTSALGLFTLVVGEGTVVEGNFKQVPWSTKDIWMKVEIKEGTGFATINNSKLLAVPYAFHAFTANELVRNSGGGNTSSATGNGVPANVWSTFGNSNTSPTTDALGTTDNADLKIITNNIERMRILSDGNIQIVKSLSIGANLKVDSNVVLNNVSGTTTNNGPFTVSRNSPTLLSGTLTVDHATDLNASLNVDGPTDLNSSLNVNNHMPTKLSGSLVVDGVTTLKDSFFVSSNYPSVMTGTVRIDSNATMKQKLVLDNPALNQDTATLVPGGALQVAGGAGIGGNLTVAGSAKIGGGLTLSNLKVTGAQESTNTSNGALTVAGGVGIGKRLNVGGMLTVTDSADYVANFVNKANKNGISIQLQAGTPTSANQFVTFKNAAGNTVGSIQGETLDELRDNWNYISEKRQYQTDIAFGSLDLAFGVFDVALAVSGVIAASSSATGCIGLGACVTTPIPSFIVHHYTGLAMALAKEATIIAGVATSASFYDDWKTQIESKVGVTYESGSGDYAEYLKKERMDEVFNPGDIVGVKGGIISKNVVGAEKVMVISNKPIVLGNMPDTKDVAGYEKVAFLGQVPVRVFGKVNIGDYIIPNGNNNGVGIAISPSDISAKNIKNIVGIAWSASSGAAQLNIIKVAVGLNVNDNQKLIDDLQNEISNLKSQIAETNRFLASRFPEFKGNATAPQATPVAQQPTQQPIETAVDWTPRKTPDIVNNIEYYHATKEDIEQALAMAQKKSQEEGMDVANNEFWKKVNSDNSFKEAVINKIKQKVEAGIAEAKLVNAKRQIKL